MPLGPEKRLDFDTGRAAIPPNMEHYQKKFESVTIREQPKSHTPTIHLQ
jgi:hypothetical protein